MKFMYIMLKLLCGTCNVTCHSTHIVLHVSTFRSRRVLPNMVLFFLQFLDVVFSALIIIFIIIIIIIVITFTQGIYSYIPETNHVSRVYIYIYIYIQQSFIYNCVTCNVISPVKNVCNFTLALSVVCVCSDQYGCCWQFLNFVLSWYVAQILCE